MADTCILQKVLSPEMIYNLNCDLEMTLLPSSHRPNSQSITHFARYNMADSKKTLENLRILKRDLKSKGHELLENTGTMPTPKVGTSIAEVIEADKAYVIEHKFNV